MCNIEVFAYRLRQDQKAEVTAANAYKNIKKSEESTESLNCMEQQTTVNSRRADLANF